MRQLDGWREDNAAGERKLTHVCFLWLERAILYGHASVAFGALCSEWRQMNAKLSLKEQNRRLGLTVDRVNVTSITVTFYM